MGKREEQRDATRASILNSSLRLFTQRGFKATTMREIASEAGIALGTTYNYFPTKEHIALHFFERSLETVIRRHRDERVEGMTLDEQVFLLLAIQIEEVTPYEEFLSLIVTQAAAPQSRLNPCSEDAARLRKHFMAYVDEVFFKARARDELPNLPGQDEMLRGAFWVFNLGILMFWLNDESPDKEDTYVLLDKTLRFILNALRGGTTDALAFGDLSPAGGLRDEGVSHTTFELMESDAEGFDSGSDSAVSSEGPQS
jgi:AcrR family transcriptional regulator